MPPKPKIFREQIVNAALTIVQAEGIEPLNARRLASELHCSTQPIFSHYSTMTALKADILPILRDRWNTFLDEQKEANSALPRIIAIGLAYILFASEQPQAFRIVFLQPAIETADSASLFTPTLIQEETGLNPTDAARFCQILWAFVHGMATRAATHAVSPSKEDVAALLNLQYESLLQYYHYSTGEPL